MTNPVYNQIKMPHSQATISIMENVAQQLWMPFAFGDEATAAPDTFYQDTTTKMIRQAIARQLRSTT